MHGGDDQVSRSREIQDGIRHLFAGDLANIDDVRILQQAGAAMIAQGNAAPGLALRALLG
jgi:hypothetical protein